MISTAWPQLKEQVFVMTHGLDIRPSAGLDLVSIGALVHRLDPGTVPWRKANACQIHVSGGELNVAHSGLIQELSNSRV